MITNKSVLVVDDEKVVRVSVLRTLKPKGYDVQTVTDGYEALALLKDRLFDIVITDLKMPNMSGIEFIEMLRRTTPGIKVLLVTGYATDEAQMQAEVLAARYLPKPFKPDDLLAAVAALEAQ